MRVSPRLLDLIKDARDFLIVSHINPEGDAIGSCLALAIALKRIGKKVHVLNKCPVPEILKFLPSSELFKQKAPRRQFDVLFVVDCNTIERTGFDSLKAKNTIIVDHHILPAHIKRAIRSGSVFSFTDPDASATGELVYKLLKALKIRIDKKIATNLYTAILVDTGGFRYSNTTPESLVIASALVEAGAEPWQITKEVYENIPYNTMNLLALAFSTLERRDGVAWMTVTQDMFKKTGTTTEDTENFVDYPRKVKGIEVAVFFREDGKESCKVSFRSKGSINVQKIAERFGGGGHAAAAGCNLKGSLQKVRSKVLRVVRRTIREA
jgi:phosphoesterase RecJ-like protein